MDFGGGTIPKGENKDFLVKMFNRSVQSGRRKYWEHHHSYFEITLFKKGGGTYIVGENRRYDIKPGDIFLFGSNEIHCITDISGDDDMVLMNLHFQPRFIWPGGSDTFDSKFLKIFYQRSKSFENRLDRDNPATKEIVRLMLETEKEFETQKPEYELTVKINILKILAEMSAKFGYTEEGGTDFETKNRQMRDIEAALEFIDANLAEDISLENLASKANMSRAYFSTVFKRICGISPWDYIGIKRTELAMRYMRRSSKTMLEIASLCGFNNTANFNRTFKKVSGKTPTEYKEEIS